MEIGAEKIGCPTALFSTRVLVGKNGETCSFDSRLFMPANCELKLFCDFYNDI